MTRAPFLVVAALAAWAGAAAADDFIADCEEFKTTNEIEGDCQCMLDATATDPATRDELMATATLDDLEGLSEAAQAVVDACT